MKYMKLFEELRIWKPEIGDIILDENGDRGTITAVSDKGVASVDYGDGYPLSTYLVGLSIVGREDGKNVWKSKD